MYLRGMNRFIFISGTGRSGTHLVGRTISSHSGIEGRIEGPSTFGLITRIATHRDIAHPWYIALQKLRLRMRLRRILATSDHDVLEKSHPSLWLADDLMDWFPSSFFIGVYREVEPTVSSMLEHNGVLSWFDALPLDRPNRFLGITPENVGTYGDLTLEERCAIRWKGASRAARPPGRPIPGPRTPHQVR